MCHCGEAREEEETEVKVVRASVLPVYIKGHITSQSTPGGTT